MLGGLKSALLRSPVVRESYVQLRQQLELLPRQRRYRRRQAAARAPQSVEDGLAVLRRDGLVVFPGLVPADAVQEMRAAMDAAIAQGRYRYDGRTIASLEPPADPDAIARKNVLDPTLLSRRFVDYALQETLVDIVGAYLQVDFVIAGIVAYRTRPVASAPKGAFLWHYDHAPLQVKAICYLTDVAEDDGPFAYVTGTHTVRRAIEASYEETRIDDGSVPAEGRIACTGKAGTVVLVDTNGIHRATPNARGVRDVVSVLYDAGVRSRQETFLNLPIPTPWLYGLRPDQRHMLRVPLHAA